MCLQVSFFQKKDFHSLFRFRFEFQTEIGPNCVEIVFSLNKWNFHLQCQVSWALYYIVWAAQFINHVSCIFLSRAFDSLQISTLSPFSAVDLSCFANRLLALQNPFHQFQNLIIIYIFSFLYWCDDLWCVLILVGSMNEFFEIIGIEPHDYWLFWTFSIVRLSLISFAAIKSVFLIGSLNLSDSIIMFIMVKLLKMSFENDVAMMF